MHLIPYRKKIQQRIIATYKCDECVFAVPTRSSLRTHVNNKHKKQKISKTTLLGLPNELQVSPRLKKKMDDISCHLCESKVENEQRLKDHMKNHDEKQKQSTVNLVIEELMSSVRDKIVDGEQPTTNENNESTDLLNVESIYSCNQCEFDTDVRGELDKHNSKNVHNVENRNRTLQEDDDVSDEVSNQRESGNPECSTFEKDGKTENNKRMTNSDCKENNRFSCHLCEYESNDMKMMDDHGSNAHGIIQCGKCEYRAEDKEIMMKHMMKHTGRFNFNCNKCEFESTRQSMVKDHIEIKHPSKEPVTVETMICERCEKEFSYRFHFKQHKCEPAYKFPCEVCTFIAHELVELTEHMVKFHTTPLHACPHCDFKTRKQQHLQEHIAEIHCTASTDNDEKKTESLALKCDQCDFIADGIPGLIAHIRGGHPEGRVNCKYCSYLARNNDDLKEHMYDQHAEVIMIHTMAKQMDEVSDRFELFETFKVELGNAFNVLLDTTNAIKQELFLVRNKQAEMSSKQIDQENESKRSKASLEPASCPRCSEHSSSLPSVGSTSSSS